MSDYTQIVYFAPKDALITGNPLKKITGTQFDAELAAISTAILSKLDSADIASNAEAAALASTSKLLTPANLLYALDNGVFDTAGGLISLLTAATPVVGDELMIWDQSTGNLASCQISDVLALVPPGPTYARKTSDTSRSSTVTLTADPDLTLAVLANTTYEVEALLLPNSASATPGFGLGQTVPAGASGRFGASSWTEVSGSGGDSFDQAGSTGLTIAAATTTWVLYKGVLVVGGTAGSFTITWAQAVSNATATVLKAGSYLKLTKIA